jgi:hypothetical protein
MRNEEAIKDFRPLCPKQKFGEADKSEGCDNCRISFFELYSMCRAETIRKRK